VFDKKRQKMVFESAPSDFSQRARKKKSCKNIFKIAIALFARPASTSIGAGLAQKFFKIFPK